MKTLLRWFKFFLIKESIPLKGEAYIREVHWFRADIADAGRKRDHRRLWQYWAIFVIFILFWLYSIRMYQSEFDELESHLEMDIMGWLGQEKPIHLIDTSFSLLSAYFLYLLYFSSDMHYFREWQKKILLEKRNIKYHWPYHYKGGNASELIRRLFQILICGYQTIVLVIGKSKFQIF